MMKELLVFYQMRRTIDLTYDNSHKRFDLSFTYILSN
jgi:hypothetical protein